MAYDAAVKRWPAILAQVVDCLYRQCHTLSQEGAPEAVVTEGKQLIEKVSGMRYSLSRDRPLTELGVTAGNAATLPGGNRTYRAPTTEAYDEHIRKHALSWIHSDMCVSAGASASLLTKPGYLPSATCIGCSVCSLRLPSTGRSKCGIPAYGTDTCSFDPFFDAKQNAFNASGAAVGASAEMIDGLVGKDAAARDLDTPEALGAARVIFDEVASSSLWGNATDLSLFTNLSHSDLQKLQSTSKEQRAAKGQYVLVNQLDQAWQRVRSLCEGRIDFVLDNAGFELVTDLLFGDWLLSLRGAYLRATPERQAEVCERLAAVRARVADAHARHKATSEPPALLAVSKLQPPSVIMAAYEHMGQRHFGENYAQELAEKARALPNDIQWHQIGGLQSNKAKVLAAVPNLYAVESVDSVKLATALDKALARPENLRERSAPLFVYIQVNTSGEEGKSGVSMPSGSDDANGELVQLATTILTQCPHLRLRGLMSIGALANSQASDAAHGLENPDFAALVTARRHLLAALRSDSTLAQRVEQAKLWAPEGAPGYAYDALLGTDDEGALELSMGMSADLESAVRYGSTQVRIGTDCFGGRTTNSEAGAVRAEELQRAAETPLVSEVVFHTKNMPWFVSDTCSSDVTYTLEKLEDASFAPVAQRTAVRAMAARWKEHFAAGRFRLMTGRDAPLGASTGPIGDFWTLPHDFASLPSMAPEVLEELRKSGLVIFKGDLNYRKLTQDAAWSPTTPFEESLGALAGKLDLLALRTCKSDVCVGLREGQAEELDRRDAAWRSNGHWASTYGPPHGVC